MPPSRREHVTRSGLPRGEKPEAVRIWLLGGFRVAVGSRAIEDGQWRLRRAAALVKLLALAPGHRLHREQLMDLLWPHLAPKAAANNFHQVLHLARKILAPDQEMASRYLAQREERLLLCPEGHLWVDIEAFEETAARARRARDPAAYRAALDLYAGELLPENRYEEWAENPRQELRTTFLSLLVELAGLYEERGEHGPAVEVLKRALAEEPVLEEAHAGLMRLYAVSDRRAQALAQYERLRTSLSQELAAEPGVESVRLYEEIRAGSFPAATSPFAGGPAEEPVGSSRHNLPAPLTSFVGREREMLEVRRLLPMTRILTLSGAGGSGKTRLALEVARSLVGAYLDGAWLVELSGLSEPDLVPQVVATTFEVREQPGRPLLDTLLDALREKEMLLVLDNCEHLIDAAARLAEALLSSSPRLRVLATSREPLGILGEVLWQVHPLSLPAADGESNGGARVENLMRYEAVRLFVDRTRLRLIDFELTEENASAVARVCRKLDGIPLAIELATARMGALAVEQVAQRLDVSLDLLKGASRTAEPRQQTLRATLDWSYNLLSEAEQAMFRRLSVFAGGWTLEAAQAVCSGGIIEQEGRVSNPPVRDLLEGLADKSLVVARASVGVETLHATSLRYRMLEPIRQYAGEKLRLSEDADEVRGRHAAFFVALAKEAEPELAGPQQRSWAELLEREHDNLREVLSWSLESGESDSLGLCISASLWRFWFTRGYMSEGLRWLEKALAGNYPTASPARVKALEGMGWLLQFKGDVDRTRATYEEMLELSRELDDKGNIATALNSLGTLALAQGDNQRARALLEENMSVLRELEDERDTSTALKRFHALNLLGALAINEEGDYVKGATLWEESLALAREVGDALRIGMMLCGLGYVALMQGDHDRATVLCEETLAFVHEHGSAADEIVPETVVNLGLAALNVGDHARAAASFEKALMMSHESGRRPTVINALEGMASLAGATGEATRAAHLRGAAEAAREATDIALPPGERALHEPYLTTARSRLGETEWERALAKGRLMSLDEAAEYALAREEEPAAPTVALPETSPAGEPPSLLTRREREIAVLVALGLTNREISTRLGISERTAGNHVGTILRKLGLRSRAQIAAWVTERNLLAPEAN